MTYDIIKTFRGSPDGRFAVDYIEGQKNVELTASLAEVALKEGWVKPHEEPKPAEPKKQAAKKPTRRSK